MYHERNVHDRAKLLRASVTQKSALKAFAMIRRDYDRRVLETPRGPQFRHEVTERAVGLRQPLVIAQPALVDERLFGRTVAETGQIEHISELRLRAQRIARQELVQERRLGQIRKVRREHVHPQKERTAQTLQDLLGLPETHFRREDRVTRPKVRGESCSSI